MFRTDGGFNGDRRDELQLDRRIVGFYSNDTCINEYDDLHGHGHLKRLYRYGSIYGECNSLAECDSDLTKYLFRLNGDLKCQRSNELYMDRRLGSHIESDDTGADDDDDVYGDGYDRKLQQDSGIYSNGECDGTDGKHQQ